MALHHFGIMKKAPVFPERYESFDKDICESMIAVNDDLIEPILPEQTFIDCYCHGMGVLCKGLCYTGISLIPPVSVDAYIDFLKDKPELRSLYAFFLKAQEESKYIIHYGV